jgi:ADP-ribose pyrophosphatase YjhB (NUDIX family)
MKPQKIPLKQFKSIYNKVPRLCVDLVIKTKKGIILSKRDIKPSRGMWHLPGGTILFGEKIIDTVARVAKEETGLKLKVKKVLGTMEYLPPKPHAHTVSVAYLVKPISGKLRGSNQGREIKFFKSIPKNTIKEQEKFLTNQRLLKEQK